MNVYDILSLVVLLVGSIAAFLVIGIALTLWNHVWDNLDAIHDDVMDEWAMYAEAEYERRAEVRAFGNDIKTRPVVYYGPSFLVERWLFMRKHNASWALIGIREHGLTGYLRRCIAGRIARFTR